MSSNGSIIQDKFQINAVYFGDPDINGSWRIITSGTNLSIQLRESGSWVEKNATTP